MQAIIGLRASGPKASETPALERELSLLFGTEERRAAGLDNAAHALCAGAAGTGIAFAAVDRPAMLEIAELAIRLHVIPQRRSASLDRLPKHIPDRLGEASGTDARHGPGKTPRRQPGAIERLAYIDVAEPGDDPLVEQCRFDRGHLSGKRALEVGAVEAGVEGFGAEPREQRMRRLPAPLHIVEGPETARVVEADHGAVVEGQHHMVV